MGALAWVAPASSGSAGSSGHTAASPIGGAVAGEGVAGAGVAAAGKGLSAAGKVVATAGEVVATANKGVATSGEPELRLGALVVPSMQAFDPTQQEDAQRARCSSPTAFAARERSRTEFAHLGAARALQVARTAFPEVIEHPAGGPPQLPAGERIARYLTPDAAQLELPGGGHALIESNGAIAKETAPRHFTPLDLSLHAVGGGYAPISSDAPAHIPAHLGSGVQLADTGVSVTPVGAGGAPLRGAPGTPDGAAMVYANTQTDADTLVKPTTVGFAIDAVLRSVDSPQQLAFAIGVPRGARLASERGPAIAAVLAHGRAVATILVPTAQDAAGTPVPVVTSIHGHVLTLTVAHRAAEYQYPIDVDPEVNDSQLVVNGSKHSGWEFHTTSDNESKFASKAVYEGAGKEYLETYGVSKYEEKEVAYWGYETRGDSKIYEFKAETEGKNKEDHIESFLELQAHGGSTENKELLSTEAKEPEYARKAAEPICPKNGKGEQECLPTAGGEGNVVRFQQSATASSSKYSFSDFLYQGIVSLSEPTGTHSTAKDNTSSPELEFEVENEKTKGKEKQKRKNALYGSGSWLSKYEGAIELTAEDPGIGVSATKLEYESSAGKWEQVSEHNYLEGEHDCKGVQCSSPEHEFWTLNERLPNGEDKIRYRSEDAMPGTKSLETEGEATIKVDDAKPYNLVINGLPWGNELREGSYELTAEATDGEGSTIPSSGIKGIEKVGGTTKKGLRNRPKTPG